VEALQYLFTISFLYTIRNRKVLPTSLISQPINVKATKPTSLRMFPRWIRLHVSYTPWFVGFVTLVPICLCASSLLSQRQIGDASYAIVPLLSLSLSISIYIFSHVDRFIWSPKSSLIAMEKHYFFLYLSLLLGFPLLHGYSAYAKGTADGSEQWGYVEVRPSK